MGGRVIKSKPRLRFPPRGTKNEKPNAKRQYRTDDKLLMSKEARYRSQSDGVLGNLTEKEDFSSRTSRSSKRNCSLRTDVPLIPTVLIVTI